MSFFSQYLLAKAVLRHMDKVNNGPKIPYGALKGFTIFAVWLGCIALQVPILLFIPLIIVTVIGLARPFAWQKKDKKKEIVYIPLCRPKKDTAYNAKMKALYNAKHGIV